MKPNSQVRRKGAAKTTTAQAPNNADTFVVKITDNIRKSAASANETVEKFMTTAIRQKLENNETPLQLLLRADDSKPLEGLYVDIDGRLFRWCGDSDKKPTEYTLEDALWWWRHNAKNTNAFKDRRYKHGSAAEILISTLLYHWDVVWKAKHA